MDVYKQYYFQLKENGYVMAESKSKEGIEKLLKERFGLPAQVIDDVLEFQDLPKNRSDDVGTAKIKRDNVIYEAESEKKKKNDKLNRDIDELKYLSKVFGQTTAINTTTLHDINLIYEGKKNKAISQYNEEEHKICSEYDLKISQIGNKEYELKNPHFKTILKKKVKEFSLLYAAMINEKGGIVHYEEPPSSSNDDWGAE